jgi:hypothetical protein
VVCPDSLQVSVSWQNFFRGNLWLVCKTESKRLAVWFLTIQISHAWHARQWLSRLLQGLTLSQSLVQKVLNFVYPLLRLLAEPSGKLRFTTLVGSWNSLKMVFFVEKSMWQSRSFRWADFYETSNKRVIKSCHKRLHFFLVFLRRFFSC